MKNSLVNAKHCFAITLSVSIVFTNTGIKINAGYSFKLKFKIGKMKRKSTREACSVKVNEFLIKDGKKATIFLFVLFFVESISVNRLPPDVKHLPFLK